MPKKIPFEEQSGRGERSGRETRMTQLRPKWTSLSDCVLHFGDLVGESCPPNGGVPAHEGKATEIRSEM